MHNYKNIAVFFIGVILCFFSSNLYCQTVEAVSGNGTGSGIAVSRPDRAGVTNPSGAAGQTKLEGATGHGRIQSQGMKSDEKGTIPQITTTTNVSGANTPQNNGENELEWGVFNLTQSDIGNPIFTSTGRIVKKPNFYGSGFEIVCPGKILIPMVLLPKFQVPGLEVLVCYEPVAYTGAGNGPAVVDIKGIKATRNNSNP